MQRLTRYQSDVPHPKLFQAQLKRQHNLKLSVSAHAPIPNAEAAGEGVSQRTQSSMLLLTRDKTLPTMPHPAAAAVADGHGVWKKYVAWGRAGQARCGTPKVHRALALTFT